MIIFILAWIQLIATPIAMIVLPMLAVKAYRSLMAMRVKCCSCEKTKFKCFMYKGSGRCKKCVSSMVIPGLAL